MYIETKVKNVPSCTYLDEVNSVKTDFSFYSEINNFTYMYMYHCNKIVVDNIDGVETFTRDLISSQGINY